LRCASIRVWHAPFSSSRCSPCGSG
jgi:hypothetical protein